MRPTESIVRRRGPDEDTWEGEGGAPEGGRQRNMAKLPVGRMRMPR